MHHEAQKLTTETAPLASSELAKPAIGRPAASVSPPSACSSMAGGLLPIRAEGSLEGSPLRRAKANTPTRMIKIASGKANARDRQRSEPVVDLCRMRRLAVPRIPCWDLSGRKESAHPRLVLPSETMVKI